MARHYASLLWAFIEQVMRSGVALEYREHGFPRDSPLDVRRGSSSRGIARRIDHPQQGLADRLHPGKFEDAAFKPAHPVHSEIPAVDQRRHAHRDGADLTG
jgi:hypothetical protein